MRYFITGGAGFIGYHICGKLIPLGHEVVIYDIKKNPKDNICDKERLSDCLKETKPDIVIHLAAIPVAVYCNQHPQEAIDTNLQGTINVLDACVNSSCRRFIYTSSSFVYGNFVHTPANEDDPTSPIDFYGGTKLCGETLTKVYSQRYGIPYTIIRPSAVYGPTDCNNRVSQLFIENALNGRPLIIDKDGGAVDFTYVEDTAEGFILASLSDKAINQTFNITAGEGKTPKEFADVIHCYTPITTEIKESTTIRPKRGALDISKARELLGYKPKYTIETGVPKYLEFVKGVLNEKRMGCSKEV